MQAMMILMHYCHSQGVCARMFFRRFINYILRMSRISLLNGTTRWKIGCKFCMNVCHSCRSLLSGVTALINCLMLICTVWLIWCPTSVTLLVRFIGQSLYLSDGASRLLFCKQALIDSCTKLVGSASRQAVAVLTLVRHIYLSTLFPERRLLTDRLLELCERRLGLQPCRIA